MTDRHVKALERKVTIEELWAADYTMREIARELGTTTAVVQVTMYQMRRSGEWDLPNRPRGRKPKST